MDEKKINILIVDDEKDLCKVAAWGFEDAGFKVTKAYGGVEALEHLKNQNFDFVISDIKMPQGDGLELLRWIKQNNIHLKGIFLMSGYTSASEDNLIKVGMTKLFLKPIDVDEVIKTIEELKDT